VQAYVVCELQDKLNVLWAFIKAHLKVISINHAMLRSCFQGIEGFCCSSNVCKTAFLQIYVRFNASCTIACPSSPPKLPYQQ